MAAANREIHSYHFGRKHGIVLDFTNLRKVLQQRNTTKVVPHAFYIEHEDFISQSPVERLIVVKDTI